MSFNVSRETEQRLQLYEALIRRWNPRINLVAPSTLPDLRQRHIEDCLQIARHVTPDDGLWVDLGSGGGLPGLILAIAFADRPTRFLMVESDQRKAAFLRSAIRELDLPRSSVLSSRIEAADPLKAAYISARALAPLARLMPYLGKHLADDGQAWLMKGERWQTELDEARQAWRFALESHDSITQPGAAILKISEVSHV
ncbi:16S rRNA (guanine(527)-N(7))-methyltransferase RsmG [Paracoccus marinaquae]|uniref:Ribosomal RNA small subunit methyltransferase G n=1 Tax=Paracoccus marinaquae TaxID=2841926 RepID=A0ABS6AEQ0_9RHOB|nr:16S rRNA (guanine(527)-N(7))-methyltransferase RsmG [Paracoccus marinaquae]MBU3029069.1 16S rRNA (guanine(527)-N(7))-methyltransferase RsmG [Paracoccus marinaquae]